MGRRTDLDDKSYTERYDSHIRTWIPDYSESLTDPSLPSHDGPFLDNRLRSGLRGAREPNYDRWRSLMEKHLGALVRGQDL